MKKLMLKIAIIVVAVYGVVISFNFFIDPANIYHDATVKKMVAYLNENHIVQLPTISNICLLNIPICIMRGCQVLIWGIIMPLQAY